MKNLLWLITLIAVIVVALFAYLGAFSEVLVTESRFGPHYFVYESFTGDYSRTGPIFDRVNKALSGAGLKTSKGLGIYYDDPKQVPKNQLRSDCGSLFATDPSEKIVKLKSNLKIRRLPSTRAAMVAFPLRNKLSFFIGPSKAYPVLNAYLKEKKLEVKNFMELYDMAAKKIYYIAPTK
jgi:hypothetical protein